MKILKFILFGVVAIVAIGLIAAIFVKKTMHAERDVVINRSNDQVFNYVKMLKNQNAYSKWSTMDPEMKTEFRGEDGTVGFVSAWQSEKDDVGSGEQEITKIEEGRRIDYELRFLEPFESKATAYMITEPVSAGQTRVRWGFDGNMNYPMNLMMLFMDMEKMIGDDFQHGLERLKANLESQPAASVQ